LTSLVALQFEAREKGADPQRGLQAAFRAARSVPLRSQDSNMSQGEQVGKPGLGWASLAAPVSEAGAMPRIYLYREVNDEDQVS